MANSTYKPTGFPKGRPRNGEIRPATPGGVHQKEFRAERKDDPEYKNQRALYSQLWKLANSERSREISRNSYRRAKTWSEANGKFSK